MGFQELDPRVVSRSAKYHWEIVRKFSCDNASARAFESTLWDSPMPGYIGRFGPRCRGVHYVRNFPQKGTTFFTARYKTMREPGVARLSGVFDVTTERATVDVKGQTIEGLDLPAFLADQRVVTFYKATKGSPFRYAERAMFKVETALRGRYPVDDLLKRCGKVNASAMSSLRMAAGTVLLLSNPFSQLWFEDDLWYADLVFLYDPKKHNERLKVRRHTRLAVEIPTLDVDGNLSIATTRQALIDLPVTVDAAGGLHLSPEEAREQYEKASFSMIDQWVRAGAM